MATGCFGRVRLNQPHTHHSAISLCVGLYLLFSDYFRSTPHSSLNLHQTCSVQPRLAVTREILWPATHTAVVIVLQRPASAADRQTACLVSPSIPVSRPMVTPFHPIPPSQEVSRPRRPALVLQPTPSARNLCTEPTFYDRCHCKRGRRHPRSRPTLEVSKADTERESRPTHSLSPLTSLTLVHSLSLLHALKRSPRHPQNHPRPPIGSLQSSNLALTEP